MKIKVKRLHEKAVIPQYAHSSDACFDLVAVSQKEGVASALNAKKELVQMTVFVEFDTGLAFEIPEGYVGLVFPRSSISKSNSMLANSIGVIDSGYSDSVKVRFREIFVGKQYKVGDRVAQMMIIPIPKIELEETNELSETERGTGGFGSSGE